MTGHGWNWGDKEVSDTDPCSLQRHSSKEEAMNKSLVKENIYKLG